MLPVSIVSGSHRLSCFAMVDSGADYCIFPGAFMDALEIAKSTAKLDSNFHGPAGSAEILFCEITIDLEFIEPYTVYAGFVKKDSAGFVDEEGFGLLGQVGFFDRFRVAFDGNSKVFGIETLPST
jgi:hypothetical protein